MQLALSAVQTGPDRSTTIELADATMRNISGSIRHSTCLRVRPGGLHRSDALARVLYSIQTERTCDVGGSCNMHGGPNLRMKQLLLAGRRADLLASTCACCHAHGIALSIRRLCSGIDLVPTCACQSAGAECTLPLCRRGARRCSGPGLRHAAESRVPHPRFLVQARSEALVRSCFAPHS